MYTGRWLVRGLLYLVQRGGNGAAARPGPSLLSSTCCWHRVQCIASHIRRALSAMHKANAIATRDLTYNHSVFPCFTRQNPTYGLSKSIVHVRKCWLIEIQGISNSKMIVYRSPKSSGENDEKLLNLIDHICNSYNGYKCSWEISISHILIGQIRHQLVIPILASNF